jgi:competence protein ComEA
MQQLLIAVGSLLLFFATPQLQGQVNLNTATIEQLDLLPGVGPATAAKIVEYRERHTFHKPSQLMRIKGIGKKTFARLRKYLAVEGDTTLEVIATG